METRSAAKRRKKFRNPNYLSENNNTGEDDRITDLPDAIIHHILHFLPIQSIAQTSVLSKRWRTIWYTLPDLDFITRIPYHTIEWEKTIGKEINQILSLRDNFSGHVRTLRFRAHMTCSGLHTLIRNAVRLKVQELDIWVSKLKGKFSLPRCIITHDCLKVLKITCYSGFRLPPSIVMKSGFQKLEMLLLSCVHLNNQTSSLDLFTDSSFPQLRELYLSQCINSKHLRVGCRLLEQLVICSCSLQGLEISAPRLETLDVSDCFGPLYNIDNAFIKINSPKLHTILWSNNWITSHNISMHNLVCLHTIRIGFLHTPRILDAKRIQMISSFLLGLRPHTVSSLTVESQFVEILSKNNSLPATFFNPFEKLKSLRLFSRGALGLASILKVCPMIHTLSISISLSGNKPAERRWDRMISWDLLSSWNEQHWESISKDLEPLLHHHLAVVKILGSAEDAISLVKFLLKHGKVLQDVTFFHVDFYSRHNFRLDEELKSRIMEFPRASTHAKLTIY